MGLKETIEKLSQIPEESFCTGNYVDGEQRCALGWLMIEDKGVLKVGQEIIDTQRIVKDRLGEDLNRINDGHDRRYKQPTPKQRALAALRDCL